MDMRKLELPKVDVPSLWQDFKAFAFKGSLIDLAVAVVIGGAFTGLVNSLVKNILMPLIAYVVPSGDVRPGDVRLGQFVGELINFFLIALVLWLVMVRLLGAIRKATLSSHPSEPTTKECPLCLSVIPFKARKCAHCTTDLPEPAAA